MSAETPVASVAPASGVFAHAATPEEAVAHHRARLAFETDASDVAEALATGDPGFVVVDVRSEAGWAQGHVEGALHLPHARIAAEAHELVAPGTPVVVYCWSPGCNGGAKGALAFASLGHPVKEMLGGFEYWTREGYPIAGESGSGSRAVDPLTGVSDAAAGPLGAPVACGC
ncbi:rhodanese-like domain-containing protein [Agromyces sp. SYSU T00194]|uniref:rhodanese-like domain-containing protein n=1 Tax=Agromyces chitinivorans TaxID=3158560 RepID=UPI003392ECA0